MITALIVGGLSLCAYALISRRPVAALLCPGLLVTFAGLAIGVHSQGWVTGLNAGTASWFGAHRSHWLTLVAYAIGAVGTPAGFALGGVISGTLLSWRARSLIPGAIVIGTVGAATLVKTAMKAIIVTPRIPSELQHIQGWTPLHTAVTAPIRWQHERLAPQQYSFPSGHVTGTAALLGIIAVCVGVGRRRTVRAWLAGLVAVAVLVAAVSRLCLNVHWLTDVIGGALLGWAFVALGALVLNALRTRSAARAVRPPPPRNGSAALADVADTTTARHLNR
jgi:membrane-associated phospholipid phosphatase